MSGLLDDHCVVVTGVLTDKSIAFAVASIAQEQGARIVLTAPDRNIRLTQRIAKRLPIEPPVILLDVTSSDDLQNLVDRLREHTDRVDGVLHAIAYAPESTIGGGFVNAPWSDVSTALQVSTYSLVALARGVVPLMTRGGAIVGLDFDASVAWPSYDWMGVAKAGLESAARYLARECGPAGIRVNLVAAGPLRTTAARAIPGFSSFEDVWADRAPLGWDVADPCSAARTCVALLSGWMAATTGEVVHADGGVHAVGA